MQTASEIGGYGLSAELRARIESLIGERLVHAQKAAGGYSATQRWIVRFASGQSVFAKVGIPPVSNRNLRAEHAVYARLAMDCMPRVIAWEDHADHPILLLPDLSMCAWPPPWDGEQLDAVLQTIEGIHSVRADLEPYEAKHGEAGGWWERIEKEPEPFLRLGLVRHDWWSRSARALVEASALVSPAGTFVCHFDLRSDNVCFCADRAMVIDWSHACLGNPTLDLGLFLPGVFAEGGPSPSELLPNAPAVAAWVAGCFAFYASKPFIPSAPHVREMQLAHLRAALPWAAAELGL